MGANLFEVRRTQKKGRGLFALQKISKGSIILKEKVLVLCIHEDRIDTVWQDPEFWAELKVIEETPGIQGYGTIGRLVRQYVEEATAEGFNAITELRGAHPDFREPLVDMFLTNRLRLGEKPCWAGLGKYSSIINHACISNAHLSSDWDDDAEYRMIAHVKATKDIAVGEEITISYLEITDNRDRRQRCMQAFFKFLCACDICEVVNWDRELKMTKLGDAYQAGGISSGLEDPWNFFRNAATIYWGLSELKISDRRVADLWLRCGVVAAYHSDAVRARYFFRYARSWQRIGRREDCEQVERLTYWSDMPAQHAKWGRTNQGASEISYDPIIDDDERYQETISLLLMTDYQTLEYRRIAPGADRDLSRRARAMIRERSPYYTAKIEDDAQNLEASAKRAALEEAKQKAQASRDALIAEIDSEEPKITIQGDRNVPRTLKKAKKRKKQQQQKKKSGGAHLAADIQDSETSGEVDPASMKVNTMYLAQLARAETMNTEHSLNAGDDRWKKVISRKKNNAKDKGKQKVIKAPRVDTAENSKDAHTNLDMGSTCLSNAENNRAQQDLSVGGEEEQSHKVVNARQPHSRQSRREADSPSVNTEMEQFSTNQGNTDPELSFIVLSRLGPGQATGKADEVNKLEDREAVAALLQVVSDRKIGRPHAASCPAPMPPLERDLTIQELKAGVRARQAKIRKLEEEIKELRDEIISLGIPAISDADWEDIKADHEAYSERLAELLA